LDNLETVETSGTQDTEVRQSTTDNLQTLETSGTQDTEGRQNIGQSRDTGNIRNTRHKSKKNRTQQTI
jgi:hypothetical protein